jgi:hypothetical protein
MLGRADASIALLSRNRCLVTLLLMLLTATTAWAWNGSGMEESPYEITSTVDLDQLASDVNDGNSYEGKYFVLTKDITYTHTTDWNNANSKESNYTAIGTSSHPSAASSTDRTIPSAASAFIRTVNLIVARVSSASHKVPR